MGSIVSYDTCRKLLKEKLYAMEGRRVNFRLDRRRDPIIKGLVKHQLFAYHHFMETLFAYAFQKALKSKAEEIKEKGVDIEIELEPFVDPKTKKRAYIRFASKDPNKHPDADEAPIDESGKRLYPRRARIRRFSYNTRARAKFRVKFRRPPNEKGRVYVRPDDARRIAEELSKRDKKDRDSILKSIGRKVERVKIGEVPVMVGSGYCSLRSKPPKFSGDLLYNDRRDPGGYIIHEGTDRAIIMKETSAHRVFIIAKPKPKDKTLKAVSSRTATYNKVRKTEISVNLSGSRRIEIARPRFSPTAEGIATKNKKGSKVPIYAVFEALYRLIKDERNAETIEVDEDDLDNFVLMAIAPHGSVFDEFDYLLSVRKNHAAEFRESIRKQSLERAKYKLTLEYDRKGKTPTQEEIEKEAENIFQANRKRFIRDYVAKVFLQDFFQDYKRDDPTRNIYYAKALVLGNAVKRILLRVNGDVPYDDRDHYRFKRTLSAGELLAMIVSEGIKEYVNALYNSIADKMQDLISERFSSGAPENDPSFVAKAMKIIKSDVEVAGDKSDKFNDKTRSILGTGKLLDITGITEIIERTNHYHLLALLRRIKVLTEKKRKNIEVRDLHPTQRGRMCPDETPDGQSIGIQKHMSIESIFTQGLLKHERELLMIILHAIGLETLKKSLDIKYFEEVRASRGLPPAHVILDGEVIGTVSDPEAFVEEFRRIRRFGLPYVEKKYPKLLKKLQERMAEYKRQRIVGEPEIELQAFFDYALKEVNIHYSEAENTVRIASDGGRMRRPLFVVYKSEEDLEMLYELISGIRDGDPKEAFVEVNGVYLPSDEFLNRVIELSEQGVLSNARDRLVSVGIIEYLDAQEEEYAYVALRPKDVTPEHTHLEIHPARIFGVSASLLPFQEHNHSPRNIYGAGMAKQAIGLPYADFPIRVMSSTRILFYPQIPLVTTKGAELSGYHERPYGENMIVAVHVMEGYNMRDAIVINQTSVERGLARDYHLKRDEIILLSFSSSTPEGVPKYTQIGVVVPRQDEASVKNIRIFVGAKNARRSRLFRRLGEDGVIEPETVVKHGEIVVGRTQPDRFANRLVNILKSIKDTSEEFKEHFAMYVNDVFFFRSPSDYYVYIRYRDHRPPSLGDKFATRQGQKGVVGMLYKAEDLPYTADGLVPDLVLNPHAMPSRMTLGLVVEGLASLIALKTGKPFDGTPFRFKDHRVLEQFKHRFPDRKLEEISAFDILQRRLKELGFNPYGERTMYDGRTGRMLKTKIFLVSLHYRRLKHEVRDKMHMRARGKYQLIIRQPTEGKARGGGLRVGEMERDTFVGHGASFVLLDRMLVASDETTIYVCKNCGGIGYIRRTPGGREEPVCPFCGNPDLYPVKVPYPFYLLYVTLLAMGIMPRIKLRSRFD